MNAFRQHRKKQWIVYICTWPKHWVRLNKCATMLKYLVKCACSVIWRGLEVYYGSRIEAVNSPFSWVTILISRSLDNWKYTPYNTLLIRVSSTRHPTSKLPWSNKYVWYTLRHRSSYSLDLKIQGNFFLVVTALSVASAVYVIVLKIKESYFFTIVGKVAILYL